MRAAPRIFVSAGEPSGDAHAARVVEALKLRWPGAAIDAFGGPALSAAGANVRFPMEPYTAMGLFEAASKLPSHLRLLRLLRREFRTGRYDLFLPVDYPGFNLKLAEAARSAGLRTLYYIAPQLWAWRPGRAQRMRRAVDTLAVILPFEKAYFESLGVRAHFVGHPLAEREWPTRGEARAALGLGEKQRILAIFPGSRTQEIKRLWPTFLATAERLRAAGACDQVLVAGTRDGEYPNAAALRLVRGEQASLMRAADAVLAKSGTTTLEAAVAGIPMVVAYRVHPLTAVLVRRLMTVGWISLVNLVAGRQVVPELVQRQVTPEALVATLQPLLDRSSAKVRDQLAGFEEVRRRLGDPGAAQRVAALAGELVG